MPHRACEPREGRDHVRTEAQPQQLFEPSVSTSARQFDSCRGQATCPCVRFRHPPSEQTRCRAARLGLSWLQRDADEKRHARKSRTPQGCGIGRAMRDSNDPSSHAFTRRARASCRSRLRPPPSPGMTRAPAPTLPDLLRLRSDPVQAARCRRTRGRAAGRRRGQPRPPV